MKAFMSLAAAAAMSVFMVGCCCKSECPQKKAEPCAPKAQCVCVCGQDAVCKKGQPCPKAECKYKQVCDKPAQEKCKKACPEKAQKNCKKACPKAAK